MRVTFLVPSFNSDVELESTLNNLKSLKPLTPFETILTDFVVDLSKFILLDKESREYPELIVLANFFRAYNVNKLKSEFCSSRSSFVVPRGIVFHIAPSNVDSIFLYSSLLSLLSGNINIIRISQSFGEQVEYVIRVINRMLQGKYRTLRNYYTILSYPHDDTITSFISDLCSMRVVWGGDSTVRKIRSIPLRPTASEICFPDRFSIALLNAAAVLELGVHQMDDLASRLIRDSMWFNQQACSSPRLVIWIGDGPSCASARTIFWEKFSGRLRDGDFLDSPGMAMDRFVAACRIASERVQSSIDLGFPTRIFIDSSNITELKPVHCGSGLYYEQFFPSISTFFQSLSDIDQTLSVFGFSLNDIMPFIKELPPRAIDRVVDVGDALTFSNAWDGYNLLRCFSREIYFNLK